MDDKANKKDYPASGQGDAPALSGELGLNILDVLIGPFNLGEAAI